VAFCLNMIFQKESEKFVEIFKNKIGLKPVPFYRKSNPGFSLMELLLYISILSIVSISVVGFLSETYRYYYNVKFKGNVSQNLRFVSQVIEQGVRQASGINGASTTLSLAMNDSTKNPTIFGLENGYVYKKEGSSEKLYLNDQSIQVTTIDFSYLTTLMTRVNPPHQWAWSGGGSSNNINEGTGWINFNSNQSAVWVPLGTGEFLGMAEILSTGSFISLNCASTNSCSTVDYKVTSNAYGQLSGWAWSDMLGWVSFDWQDTSSTVPYSVSVSSSTGDFSGWAWSENIGWVSFNCANLEVNSCATVSYKVKANKDRGATMSSIYVNLSMSSRSAISAFNFSDTYSFSVPLMPLSNITVTNLSTSAGTSTVTFTITGTNFISGAKAKLSRAGYSDIYPTADCGYAGLPTYLQSCSFDVSGEQIGFWDVMVVNPDGQIGVFPRGFQIQ